MDRKKYSLILLLLLCYSCLYAQVNVKAKVDRTTILIGEPIRLDLEATVPSGTGFSWFRTDTIPHFDIVDPGKRDSAANGGSTLYRQQLVITSFDSGSWPIPAFILQAGRKRYRTDTIGINVTYLPMDTAKDYNDIKEIIEVERPRNPWIFWIIAAALLIAAAIIYYFWRKRKKPIPVAKAPVSKLSPVEEAMQSLDNLKKEQLPQKAQPKLYYTRLNDILRWYLWRRFAISSIEKTNDELVMQLRQTRLSKQEYTSLAQALRMADFVKFARYTPPVNEQEETFNVIKNSINRLEASAPST